ncbi:MAG: threonine--tRNA ligase [Alphaproteobacteria bacterium]|nr:MAG: threonine--tRNA ligase [Alphaproteobacteria bacterium]
MIKITLPDGNVREYPASTTGFDIASSISKSLAKNAVTIKVNGEMWDLSRAIEKDAKIQIITRDSEEALGVIRHDCAHIMAEAVQELFPDTQVTIGPNVENGFYYDFYREKPFTMDDFPAIEKRMKEIVARDEQIVREVWDRNEAIKFFEKKGEKFKAEIIRDLPETETITCYRQGNFIDLCRGPHMSSTSKTGTAFKLMKVAGAYWRGDHRKEQLQRIYATAWADQKQLDAHLHQLAEAERRDHRKLGREMQLFHLQEEAVGSIFWHPKGWTMYRILENYIRDRITPAGYVEVNTPTLVDRSLWEASGHWEKFRENMFTINVEEDKILALKPMNCPCHVQIFKQGIKSYRDLPLRMAEFGSCHRNESSGSMHGIMRIRAFKQDDAHIFCTPDQIISESQAFCSLLLDVYKDFGFNDVRVKFSDRPAIRAGSDAIWDRAEAALKSAVEAAGLPYTLNPGEGAFYGPKLEFVLRDAIGRDWQCGTLQVDFVLPERLDAEYVGEDGQKHRPVMLHRAILGSLERFIGILIEQYAGRLPLWLAPTQIVIATIVSDADHFAEEIEGKLFKMGMRAEADLRNESINYKVREHSLAKVPVMLVLGKREAMERKVTIRYLGGDGQDKQETLGVDEALDKLKSLAVPPHKK